MASLHFSQLERAPTSCVRVQSLLESHCPLSESLHLIESVFLYDLSDCSIFSNLFQAIVEVFHDLLVALDLP
jgi:hypothetical protein